MLRRIHPDSGPVDDPVGMYLADARADRPWVMLNMVVSVDGATAIDGGSTALGDEDDLTLFKAIRTVPDVILVGAGTVRAENYGPVTLDAARRQRREAVGMSQAPTLVIVSGSLGLDVEARVFSDPEHKPLIVTGVDAAPGRLAVLGDAADIVFVDPLTPEGILAHLGGVVLLEGGPTLNGQFIAAGLVDEVNVTVSPLLVSGDSRRMASGSEASPPLGMVLDRILIGERSLFLRYLRHRNDQ